MPNIVMADQPSGGGDLVLLASGTYTKAADGSPMKIPVSYSGTPRELSVSRTDANTGVASTLLWQGTVNANRPGIFSNTKYGTLLSRQAGGTYNAAGAWTPGISETEIAVGQASSNYPIKAGDYYWEIWGVAT